MIAFLAVAGPLLLRADSPTEIELSLHRADDFRLHGAYDQAEREYSRLISAPDLTDTQRAKILAQRVALLIDTEQFREAEAAAHELLDLESRRTGPASAETALALSLLGSVLFRTGDLDQSAALLERAAQIFMRDLGPEHVETARTNSRLAAVFGARGQLRRAEDLLRRSETAVVKNLGPVHPETAALRHSLGLVYFEEGRFARSESELLSALRIWESVLGAKNPFYVHTANLLVLVECAAREYSPAAKLLERILPLSIEIFGANHPETARVLRNQALLESGLGNVERAQSVVRRAIQIQANELPFSRTELLESIDFYRRLARRSGDLQSAGRMTRWANLIKAAGPSASRSSYVRWSCASL